MLASCSEHRGNRGTTYETADANKNEHVNPNQIRGYGKDETVADMTQGTEDAWRLNSQQISTRMAADLQLDPETRNKVEQVISNRERRLHDLDQQYNYSATNRMGGQASNDTRNDTSDNPSMQMDANRPNNQGNAYAGNNKMGGNQTSNQQQDTNQQIAGANMDSNRQQVMADADRELKGILSADQYKKYEQNRASYTAAAAGDSKKTNASGIAAPNNSGDMTNDMHNSGVRKGDDRSHLDKTGTDRMIRQDKKLEKTDDGNGKN